MNNKEEMKYNFIQRLLGLDKIVDNISSKSLNAVEVFEHIEESKNTFNDLLEDHQIQTAQMVKNNLHRLGEGIIPQELGFIQEKNTDASKGKVIYRHKKFSDLKVMRIQGHEWAVFYGDSKPLLIMVKDANWFVLSINSILSSHVGDLVSITD